MSKAVMISIQPKWCELITNGKKTIEVRKTKPEIETPFKCYIYCTLGDCGKVNIDKRGNCYNGKVIGEFVCDEVFEIYECFEIHDELPSRPIERWLEWDSDDEKLSEHCCLTHKEIVSYLGRSKSGYGWHISDLVIYGNPKKLSEFYRCCGDTQKCEGCYAHYYSNTESGKEDYCCSVIDGCKPLERPPYSWCYVEQLRE